MGRVILASVLALFVGLAAGTTANAWPNFDIFPDPNLEDLNDFPGSGSDPDVYDEAREQLEESRRLQDRVRRTADWDFDDDGVMDEAERLSAFESDVDADGVLDYRSTSVVSPLTSTRLQTIRLISRK